MLHVASARAAAHCPRQGIDSLLNRQRIYVYPNPVATALKVETVKLIKEMAIFSAEGRLVKQQGRSGNNSLLPVPELPHGAYILRIVFEDGTRASKMIIKQ